jgi:predicted PurR-regulated permease PerM
LEDRVLIGFVIVATLAMAWVAAPFYGAILWALVAAIVFAPVNERLVKRIPHRKTSAASATLLLIIAAVIVPAFMLGSLLIEQAISTYVSLQNRELDVGKLLADVQAGLPSWMAGPMERFDIRTLPAIEEKLSNFLTSAFRIAATQALNFGQSAFSFVIALGMMLYLTFFLLRDGRELTRAIGQKVPLRPEQRSALFEKFTTVIRATIKGSIVVAIVQGVLGGLAFWFLGVNAALLWGVVMGFMSLIPAIGTGIVWVPVAIYLLATGSIWQGVVLVLFGFFVISMVDNVLRPILVGKDTRMPDYVVLISTLGGISVMGINGFIVGPVIAAMFIAAWEIFAEWRKEGAAPTE